MKILEEIKKGVYAHYQTTTLWTVDAVPFYQDFAPNGVKYPIITFNHVSSNNSYAMPNIADGHVSGYNYVDSRWRFTIYTNDRQNTQLEDINDRLEEAFHRVKLTFGNDVTHIETYIINASTAFYDQKLKVWSIRCDYRIIAGA